MNSDPSQPSLGQPRLWGYCPGCQLWIYSNGWHEREHPSCPRCQSSPDLLEILADDYFTVSVMIEVPAGREELPF